MADRVTLFDVNETLLDTAALDPWLERVLGDAGDVTGEDLREVTESLLGLP